MRVGGLLRTPAYPRPRAKPSTTMGPVDVQSITSTLSRCQVESYPPVGMSEMKIDDMNDVDDLK